jgi:hypothetical protein
LTPLRDIYLQRPAKPGAASFLRRFGRHAGSSFAYVLGFLLVAAALTWLQAAWFHRANLPATELVTCLLAVVVIWYVEFHRVGTKRRRAGVATKQLVMQPLHDLRFDDGSQTDFIATGVFATAHGLIVAIDPKRSLLRVIAFAADRNRRVDWLCALPDNTDLDVAPHTSPRQPSRPVPSLIFSEEQEDGFKVIAWPLAPESVETARELVAELRAQRGA